MRNDRMALRLATIGRNGQTAQAIAAVCAGNSAIDLIQADRAQADLRDPASLAHFIDTARPDAVVNAGAYNLVDRAESESDEAMRVNADGPLALARICHTLGLPFIHMSTDLVFGGTGDHAHTEDDAPNPLSAYGRSKLAGEQAVAAANASAITARVCWVYSEFADNFVSKMITFARAQPRLNVVSDQIGSPTYAPDIARTLVDIAQRMHGGASDLPRLLHVAAPWTIDRASMARDIMEESRRQGGPFAPVDGVPTATFNAPARRPLNARLSGARATALLDIRWTDWDKGLKRSVAGVLARTS
jgi:dTDP-4-dehydrorhamnose reductase